MGLFRFLQKGKLKSKKENDLSHLTEDGQLPYGWIYAHIDFVNEMENTYGILVDTFLAEKKNGVLAEYKSLKALVAFMEDAKKICTAKGECFERWSKILVSRPDDLEQRKERLDYLETHLDELIKHEKGLEIVRNQLKQIVKKEPGIKQENIYKRFGPEWKNDISNELYIMGHNGEIRREKSGRTYALYALYIE